MKLLIFPAVDETRLEQIRTAAQPMHVVNARDEAAAQREIADADAFFGKLTPELLDAANRLQWVQTPTASLEHYMFPALTEHPCRLSNMRGLFSDVIADHVLGLIVCFARNLHRYIRQQQQAVWSPIGGEEARTDFVTGPGSVSSIDRRHQHLADCTLGAVAAGSIGREVCRRAQAFGMNTLAVDPVVRNIPGVVEDVWTPDRLPELLGASDFVVISAPHTPQTEKMFRRRQFQQMKTSACLINVGRGAVVDLNDLTESLRAGEIAGAGLDVFETEPLPSEHPLWTFDNVIVTPHVAAASPRIAERHLQTLLVNVRRFVEGKSPLTLVDKRRWC